MNTNQTSTMSETCLRSNADKAALGWDLDSMESRMSSRLSQIRKNKEGSEPMDGKTAPRVGAEKERARS